MHPFATFTLADDHIRDLHAGARRRRLVHLARLGRRGGARNTAPAREKDAPLRFLGQPDER